MLVDIVASQSPAQRTSLALAVITGAPSLLTLSEAVVTHPLASVTVTL